MSASPDPTSMRGQPALTTASGTSWLVIAAISAALIAAMFLALYLAAREPLALLGLVIVVVVPLVMVGVRLLVRPRRARLVSLAVLYGAMLLAALVVTLSIATGSALELPPNS